MIYPAGLDPWTSRKKPSILRMWLTQTPGETLILALEGNANWQLEVVRNQVTDVQLSTGSGASHRDDICTCSEASS